MILVRLCFFAIKTIAILQAMYFVLLLLKTKNTKGTRTDQLQIRLFKNWAFDGKFLLKPIYCLII